MRFESIADETSRFPMSRILNSEPAKLAVIKWFKNIRKGRLTIVDEGSIYSFGEAADEAKVAATIHVTSKQFYSDILFGGAVGAAESYMRGSWTSPDLVNAIRVVSMNLDEVQKLNQRSSFANKFFHWLYSKMTQNSETGSRKNISAHYDLGNDFFSLFLDDTMMYSSGVWGYGTTDLKEASVAKLDLICKKLKLTDADHVVEIGTGWGGFAMHAASNYGCKVTTTTISKEQYEYTLEKVKLAGLESQITVLMKDYRELEGKYDKLVSIEMIEAVGHSYLPGFFKKCNDLLKDDGCMLIQAITISDQRYKQSLKSVDFIQRYIFPGGCLPCVSSFSEHVAKYTDMQVVDLHDITFDYAFTLKHWRERFFQQLTQVKSLGFNDVFIRMWDFYLCYCEGAFRERVIQTSQFVVSKPGYAYQAADIR